MSERVVEFTDFVQLHACVKHLLSLSHPPTVVDVGAFHGFYAVIFGKLVEARGGQVIAIEPTAKSFTKLTRNVAGNRLSSVVSLHKLAITEHDGISSMSFDGSKSKVNKNGSEEDEQVRCCPLSKVLSEKGVSHVDLLLIDVEGAELPVLRSINWERVSIGQILCEMHPYNWLAFDYSGQDMSRFLVEHGLRCLDMYLHEHISFDGQQYIGPTLLTKR